jgi:hypothetical protein
VGGLLPVGGVSDADIPTVGGVSDADIASLLAAASIAERNRRQRRLPQ